MHGLFLLLFFRFASRLSQLTPLLLNLRMDSKDNDTFIILVLMYVGAFMARFRSLNGGVGNADDPQVEPSVSHARSTATKRRRGSSGQYTEPPEFASMNQQFKLVVTAYLASQQKMSVTEKIEADRDVMWEAIEALGCLTEKEQNVAAEIFHTKPFILSGFLKTPVPRRLSYIRHLVGSDVDEP